MIAFVTSLRHPQNSADYSKVESLLAETLGSICAQRNDDYIVIVVGNRPPSFKLPNRVQFVSADFPAPAPPSGPQTDRDSFLWDKGTKIGLGLLAARSYRPEYVMIFDADDYVSNRIAGHAQENPGKPGWVIDRGWIYSHATGVYRPQGDFNRACGTCHVVNFTAYDVPEHLDLDASQDEIAAAFGDRLRRILGAHRDARTWLADAGWELEPLPFRGAVYNVDTGENHSGKSLSGFVRPASYRFQREFGIRPAGTPLSRLRVAFGPDAIADASRRVSLRLGRLTRGRLTRQGSSTPSSGTDGL
ncbi:hypothetical protein J2Y46_001530 [Microbacterium sp. BE35]|uniref:hypothetical protein n=1 Tax=Microbacterium sp. BE35 TaxID=2817773 RepID=UPI00285EDC2D|nr:hypothetical protein [Microbacterium sp. BE35]MDR7188707.1 hypothetical protein [Microbacterium sp. BE35]